MVDEAAYAGIIDHAAEAAYQARHAKAPQHTMPPWADLPAEDKEVWRHVVTQVLEVSGWAELFEALRLVSEAHRHYAAGITSHMQALQDLMRPEADYQCRAQARAALSKARGEEERHDVGA